MKILLATDFSEASVNALRYCLSLAGRDRLHLFVAHVYRHGAHPNLTPARLDEFYEQEYQAFLTRTRRFSGIYPHQMEAEVVRHCALEVEVSEGDVSESLYELAHQHKADLLVIGSKEHPGLLRRLFGPLSRSLIRDRQLPLLIVPEIHVAGPPSQIGLLVIRRSDEQVMRTWLAGAGVFAGIETVRWTLEAAGKDAGDKVPGQQAAGRRLAGSSISGICAQLRASNSDLVAVVYRQDVSDTDTRYRDQLIHHLYDHLERPLLCLHA
ncbi:MAG: universal stress protein [Saprospiraceae bacterium]|nr:universal stress protein [Saprospiraceae bacterium]